MEEAWYGGLLHTDNSQVELQVMFDVVGKYAMKWRVRSNNKKEQDNDGGWKM